MNPNYVDTITLYRRRADGTYARNVIDGCFWKAGIAVTQSGTNASQVNTYTVRIPKDKAPAAYDYLDLWASEAGQVITDETGERLCFFISEDGSFRVALNDIVIKGECPDWISDEKGYRAAEVLNRYKPDAFRVTAFADNTSHLMDKHYRLGG